MRSFALVAAILFCAALAAHAQGGPPFITDDPGTPGNHHWEVNVGWLGSHNPAGASYQLPDFDINYGLGDRIQLKYELPIAATTDEHNTTRAGLGESLLGVKWRYYEHHRKGEAPSDENLLFSLGTYPQASINNPTSAVRREVVEPGPQYYLPVECTAKVGPIGLNGELGRWFGNRHVPDRWGRGLIAGHEFSGKLELYGEIYALSDINSVGDDPRQRSVTLDFGGRRSLTKSDHIRLLFMGGRSMHTVRRTNGEPDWIAYLGVQFLLNRRDEATRDQ